MGRMSLRIGASEARSKLWEWSMGHWKWPGKGILPGAARLCAKPAFLLLKKSKVCNQDFVLIAFDFNNLLYFMQSKLIVVTIV